MKSLAVCLCCLSSFIIAPTYVTAQQVRSPEARQPEEEKASRRVRALAKKLNDSKGNDSKIEELVVEMVRQKDDVSAVVALFAIQNVNRHVERTNQLPFRVGLDLEPLDTNKTNDSLARLNAQFRVLLRADSKFRDGVDEFIADADSKPEGLNNLLAKTYTNYSEKGLEKGAGASRLPFPFCIPNCD